MPFTLKRVSLIFACLGLGWARAAFVIAITCSLVLSARGARRDHSGVREQGFSD
jgi:hypothetical protein